MRCDVLAVARLSLLVCWVLASVASADVASADVASADVASAAEETMHERRAQLEQMTDAEKTRLLQKKRRFDELSSQEQDRLRQLYQDLSADPQCERLRGVLERYSEWLKTLTPVERAEIAKLSAEQRLARVRKLIDAQDARRFRMMFQGQLSPGDALQ